jgi:hypothetical protein
MFKRLFSVTFDGLEEALDQVIRVILMLMGLFIGLYIGLTEPGQFNPAQVEITAKVMAYLVIVLMVCSTGLAAYLKWGRRPVTQET